MCDTCKSDDTRAMGRRAFLRLAAAGAGVAAVAPAAGAGGKAKALMLSCMDYRLVDDFVYFMAQQGLHDGYDHVVLAGASLGVMSEKFTAWHETFWAHLDVAIQLHHVEEVVVLDHRDCGAYRLALGAEAVDTPEKETAAHADTIRRFAAEVRRRHPDLAVRGYLMALDGSTEALPIT